MIIMAMEGRGGMGEHEGASRYRTTQVLSYSIFDIEIYYFQIS